MHTRIEVQKRQGKFIKISFYSELHSCIGFENKKRGKLYFFAIKLKFCDNFFLRFQEARKYLAKGCESLLGLVLSSGADSEFFLKGGGGCITKEWSNSLVR